MNCKALRHWIIAYIFVWNREIERLRIETLEDQTRNMHTQNLISEKMGNKQSAHLQKPAAFYFLSVVQ